MFKKHAIQVTVVKTPKQTMPFSPEREIKDLILSEDELLLAKETAKELIYTVGGTVGALIVLSTVCKIVINTLDKG